VARQEFQKYLALLVLLRVKVTFLFLTTSFESDAIKGRIEITINL